MSAPRKPGIRLDKTCGDCGTTDPECGFRFHNDHGIDRPLPWCKDCELKRRARQRAERKEYEPYRRRQQTYFRDYYQRLRQDPERLAKRRVSQKKADAKRWRKFRNDEGGMLPAGPFAAYLPSRVEALRREIDLEAGVNNGLGDSEDILSERLGMAIRNARRLMSGEQQLVRLDTVDRVLTLDPLLTIDDLYPWEEK